MTSVYPNRRSIRLSGYDYAQAGLYFATICTQHRVCLFGKVDNGIMRLNRIGEMVEGCWKNIPAHYPHVVLHEYVIMPNHLHGIIEITDSVGAGFACPDTHTNRDYPARTEQENTAGMNAGRANPDKREMGRANPAPTLGNIIGYFKYQSTKMVDLPEKLWQRNYYEHIIRDDKDYANISEYIENNPVRWETDNYYI